MGIKAKGCVGKFCASVGRDDDLVDELWKVGGKIGKFSGSISRDDDLVDDLGDAKWQAQQRRKWADNSLTCDSEGNCMLKDELKFEKVKAVAGKAAQRFPGAASKVANKVKSLRGRDDDDDDLVDELKFEKVKAAAGAAAKKFPGAASKVANKVKSLRGRDDDDE